MRDGNLVRPLIGGTTAFRRIGEAVDGARHSVWLTVAFYDDDLPFPDGRGALFDLLDRAAARGVDVRALFWRHNPESSGYGRTFWGTEAERELLRARSSRLRIRWDRAAGAFCQHQKSWMIDAGTPSETAFVGGINLTAKALGRHDAYVEVTGPSATDVQHNFAQRWNDASERHVRDGNWACDGTDELPLPIAASARAAPAPCRSSACCRRASARSWNSTNARSMPPSARSTSRTRRSRFHGSPSA